MQGLQRDLNGLLSQIDLAYSMEIMQIPPVLYDTWVLFALVYQWYFIFCLL